MTDSDVSVVIPTYNGGLFIESALQSIERQFQPPIEILVVDDGSTDNTLESVERVSRQSSVPIRTIRLEQNSGGPAKPMNVGIEQARGSLIAMLDQDDLMCQRRIEYSVAALNVYPQASFIFGNYDHFNDSGLLDGPYCSSYFKDIAELTFQDQPAMAYLKASSWRTRFFIEPGIQRSCSNHFFRKSMWKSVDGYREGAGICSDLDFVIRGFGEGVVWLRERVFEKRLHANNVCDNSLEQWLRIIGVQQEIARLDRSEELLRAAEELTRQAARKLRWNARYKESRTQALRLLKYGHWFEGATEYLKSSALSWQKTLSEKMSGTHSGAQSSEFSR